MYIMMISIDCRERHIQRECCVYVVLIGTAEFQCRIAIFDSQIQNSWIISRRFCGDAISQRRCLVFCLAVGSGWV